jgi:hypothetical protein
VNEAEQLIARALREIADEAPAPRPMAGTAWRAGRRRRAARLTATAASGAAAISAVVLIPLAVSPPGPPAPGGSTPAAGGTVGLRSPVQLRQVASVSPEACPAGSDGLPSDVTPLPSCVHLTGAGMTITRVRSVRLVVRPLAVLLHVTGPDARRLERLSARLAGQPTPRCELAIIVNGRVVAQPVVDGPIPAGLVEISGLPSRAAAEHLIQLLRRGALALPAPSILRP